MTNTLALTPVKDRSPVLAMPSIPPIGNIDAYISAVNRIPMLTLEQEQQYARELKDSASIDAAGKLVLSHLRLVVSIARSYLGYGLPHADLIQEGNIGLMKAVKRFDPDRGVRLVSFAMTWIKAEMHEYILKNWRMAKLATTKAQRKLFFNLRSMKGDASTLDTDQVDHIAKALKVKPEEVREMETRFSGGDIALEGSSDDADDNSFAPISYLVDARTEPTMVLERKQRDELASSGIEAALAKLDDRSRRIIETRWLNVEEDGHQTLTLHELADEFGVSAERIRQIETSALKKMKGALVTFSNSRQS